MQPELLPTPPIIFELKEMPDNVKVRRHCNVYPCFAEAKFYFIANFGTTIKVICGVCEAHSHRLDDFLEPLRLIQN